MNKFLDEVQLNKVAPSIFATGGSDKVSDKYGFIPTIAVVKGLEQAGFYPVMAAQSRTRIEGRGNHVKHMIRFRHQMYNDIGGAIPEIVLVNSHDGSTSYQLRSGIYRLVCANGMIVGSDLFCRKVKHQGDVVDRVVGAANDLIEIVPKSIETALEWKGLQLSKDMQMAFAETASTLRWEEGEELISPSKLIVPRRQADTSQDLWTTFNVIQENIIKGGIPYRTLEGQRNRTRGVNSVGENVRLNTALWSLTEKMAELIK